MLHLLKQAIQFVLLLFIDEKTDMAKIVTEWISKLDKLYLVPTTLPPSSSFKLFCRIRTVLTMVSIFRYGILLFLKPNHEYSLFLGGFFPFGVIFVKTLYVGIVFAGCLAIGVTYFPEKRMNLIYRITDTELVPYKSSDSSQTVLQKRLSEKFLHRMKLIYTVANISYTSCRVFAAIFMFYMCTVCAVNAMSWTRIIVIYFWGLQHTIVVISSVSNIIWVVGLWYVLKTHINMQVQQLSEHATLSLTLNSTDLHRNLVSIINCYTSLAVKIKEFNMFFKKLCFYITVCNTVLAACLLYASSVTINTEPLIAFILGIYYIIFEFGSLAVLGASSSIYEKNQCLYRILNQLYFRKSSTVLLRFKRKLQSMIKNTGSQTKCPLALVNIDDRIFDYQILARYVIYTIRTIAIVARLVNAFQD